jgi:hypothetical protein
MPVNDPVLLEQILNQRKAEVDPTATDARFFEVFVAEEYLKDYALSYEEMTTGLPGGGNDGGIDGMWTFVNGDLVQEDSDFTGLRRGVQLELVVMQAKRSRGFGEEPINKLIAATENLLDLSNDLASFKDRYNADVLAASELFRDAYQKLAGSFPTLLIRFVCASLGDEVHPHTKAKSNDLLAKVPALFSSADASFEFLGAARLLALARRQPKRSFALTLAESPISATGAVAYICLVKLAELHGFVTDEAGALRGALFESNVRDYQGTTEVNKECSGSAEIDLSDGVTKRHFSLDRRVAGQGGMSDGSEGNDPASTERRGEAADPRGGSRPADDRGRSAAAASTGCGELLSLGAGGEGGHARRIGASGATSRGRPGAGDRAPESRGRAQEPDHSGGG